MRSLYRDPDQAALRTVSVELGREAPGRPLHLAAAGRGDEEPRLRAVEVPPTLERWDLVESRWSLSSVVVLLAGAALAVIGVVAAGRTGIDNTWYRPVGAVAGLRHTPLLAALETAVGVLLVIAGLAGARLYSPPAIPSVQGLQHGRTTCPQTLGASRPQRPWRSAAGVHHRGHGRRGRRN